jgi:hypothetical protein
MTVQNLGRYRTTPDPDFAIVPAGTMVGVAFPATTTPLWGKRFRIRMGRNGASTPSVRLALYAKSGSAPAQLLGYSGVISASTAMTAWDNGAFYESDVAFSSDGPSNSSIPIPSGTIPVLAVLPTGADLGVGMKASDGTLYDPAFYKRSGLSTPPDPFGSATISIEGNLTIALICDVNEPPVAPNNRGPSGTINDVTGFEVYGDFRDRNSSWGDSNGGDDVGDYLRQYQVQFRRQSDGATFWTPSAFTASPTEQASDHFSVTYAGTTLSRGMAYEWRVRTSDAFAAWGDWSDWLAFTPANQGFVTLNGDPVSKVWDNTPDFEFHWEHQSGSSTNAAQIQIYQGNTLVSTSGTISKTVADGADGTLTWADTGFATLYPNGLPWGQTWKYAIRGRDTSNNWSDYSDRRQFKTDASPSIPDGLSPANGEIVTSRPLLTFQLSDADDTVATGLVGKVRIFGPRPATNADFEGGTISPWVSPATSGFTKTFAQDATVFHGGAKSGKLNVTANSNGGAAGVNMDGDLEPCAPGESITLTAWLRTSVTTIHPRLQLHWHDAAGTYLSSNLAADYTPSAANTWYQKTHTATAPANAYQCKMSCNAYFSTGGLTGSVWIDDFSFNDGLRYTRDATLNTTSGLWEYQTTSTDLPVFDDYTWDAYGFDGTLYSGAVTVEANAVKSPQGTFSYANGPTATITSPTDGGTITSSTPTVTWTSSSQNRYRLTFYEAGTTNVVYQRGWVVSSATSWTVPAGYLHNNEFYDIELIVEDNQPLQGYAQIVTVEGAFTGPPSATGFSATAIAVDDNDPWPTAIQVQWDATTEPGGTFVGYYLYRDDIGLTGTPYRVFTSPDQTSWVDPVPASGHEYTYALRVIGQRDLDRVSSARVYASATVTLGGVVLCDVNNPYTYRAVLDDVKSRERNRKRDEQTFMVGAAAKPLTFRSPTSYWEIPGGYRILPPNGASDKVAAIAQRAATLDTLEAQDPVVCYRDEHGTVLFGRIVDFTKTDNKFYPVYSFSIREENYTLGVVLDQEISE